ncbi:hypothetical protein ABRQ22_07770 [Cellulosimicrobium sp. ES-005]|uniref:Uncharacterized protein n=1 Tax=Cellulosimicrobium sp. ES-005 TaxID=3163031 RepID=A0AAU8G5V1_9MICO
MREPVQQDRRRPVLPCEQPRVVLPAVYLGVSSFLAAGSGGPVV